MLEAWAGELADDRHGIELREIAGGWRLLSNPAFADTDFSGVDICLMSAGGSVPPKGICATPVPVMRR